MASDALGAVLPSEPNTSSSSYGLALADFDITSFTPFDPSILPSIFTSAQTASIPFVPVYSPEESAYVLSPTPHLPHVNHLRINDTVLVATNTLAKRVSSWCEDWARTGRKGSMLLILQCARPDGVRLTSVWLVMWSCANRPSEESCWVKVAWGNWDFDRWGGGSEVC
jgi:hypothetical protein